MGELDKEGEDAMASALLALAWMECEEQPRLICTDDLLLVWANAAARTEFAQGTDLELKDGLLVVHERAHQAELAAFVKQCDGAISTLALSTRDGDGHLLLRARRIAAESGETGRVGLTFLRSGAGFRPHYADLERAFQLTPAEHRILLNMADGLNAEAIAEAKDLSIETVRSHIRSLYNKMGVASREAMFARIRPFRL
ncbi:MAG: helix-turn-helix transcriptional regulator [Sphingomonas sp.]|nr:helix-turn-helix transcriptional regulator [Sphingomonas sp.]